VGDVEVVWSPSLNKDGYERACRPARTLLAEADPNGVDAHTPGAKLDAGKTRVWLCIAGFARAIDEVAKVTTVGAAKYTPNGWASVPNGEERYMDAFGRHALSFGTGERVDAQTGCLHRAQMIWNLLAALELELREREANATVPE
jgi:hypothetical protein